MSLLQRFRGERTPDTTPDDLVANDRLDDPRVGYFMLFADEPDLDADGLTLALRSYHPDLDRAKAELFHFSAEDPQPDLPMFVGLMGWGRHVIQVVGFRGPVPTEIFEACVVPSHIVSELRDEARRHRGHVLLNYAGFDPDPLERYVALTIASIALARMGGLLLLNHPARTAFPAEALTADDPEVDAIVGLRVMPLPLLYLGFVKIELEGQDGVWMRTFGGHLMNLPDLAYRVESHKRGSEVFDLFSTMLGFMHGNEAAFHEGDSVRFDEDGPGFTLRVPTAEENWLTSEGTMLVMTAES